MFRWVRPISWLMVVVLFAGGYWLADGHHLLLVLLGFLYIATSYHLLATGARTLAYLTPQATWRQRWLCVALFNTAFLGIFAAIASPAATIWLGAMLAVAALCQVVLSRTPVLDVIAEGMVAAMPFMFGVLLADTGRAMALLPLFVMIILWAIASHIVWQLAEHSEQATVRLTSFVSRVGNEISIMALIGLYGVGAVLPVAYYGRTGLLLAFLFVVYLTKITPLLAVRFHARNMRYVKTWWAVRRLNYLTLALLLVYAASGIAK